MSITDTNLIYVSGKASVGKSVISEHMAKDINFKLISLDELIRDDFDGNYRLYQTPTNNPNDLVNRWEFVTKIRQIILEYKDCVIEGTIKDNELIKEIFHGYHFIFCYIEPLDEKSYFRNMSKRFEQDPTNYGRIGFLKIMDTNEFKGEGLNDFISNGIDGTIIQEIIKRCSITQFKKVTDLRNQYSNDFKIVRMLN